MFVNRKKFQYEFIYIYYLLKLKNIDLILIYFKLCAFFLISFNFK